LSPSTVTLLTLRDSSEVSWRFFFRLCGSTLSTALCTMSSRLTVLRTSWTPRASIRERVQDRGDQPEQRLALLQKLS